MSQTGVRVFVGLELSDISGFRAVKVAMRGTLAHRRGLVVCAAQCGTPSNVPVMLAIMIWTFWEDVNDTRSFRTDRSPASQLSLPSCSLAAFFQRAAIRLSSKAVKGTVLKNIYDHVCVSNVDATALRSKAVAQRSSLRGSECSEFAATVTSAN